MPTIAGSLAEPVEATASPSRRDPAGLPVPEGTRLLHIGPHKTGTTSIQGALHLARPRLLAQGVEYAGTGRQSMKAAHAVIGKARLHQPQPLGRWNALVDDVRASTAGRMVISSEAFADADPAAVKRIVRDLDPARIHVVVTLRPLARILPSQWQQVVQAGSIATFEDWLERTFAESDADGIGMWRRHRHDQLVRRWADVVGPDRLTVVVVDDRDHDLVFRAFERLLGLTEGTLVDDRRFVNRSMTLPEVEAVRAFNIAFRKRGYDRRLQAQLIPVGAARIMKRVPPDPRWAKVEMPRWALERVAPIQRRIVNGVAASGVRVIGDLESLAAATPLDDAPEHVSGVAIPPDVSGALAVSVMQALGVHRRTIPVAGEPLALSSFRTRRLIETIARRAPTTVQHRLVRRRRRRAKR